MANQTTEFKCPNCGATAGKNGKPFTRGTLNLHVSMHCPKKTGSSGGSGASCCDRPDYRLLTSQESALLAQRGHTQFTKVCKHCDEVV